MFSTEATDSCTYNSPSVFGGSRLCRVADGLEVLERDGFDEFLGTVFAG